MRTREPRAHLQPLWSNSFFFFSCDQSCCRLCEFNECVRHCRCSFLIKGGTGELGGWEGFDSVGIFFGFGDVDRTLSLSILHLKECSLSWC